MEILIKEQIDVFLVDQLCEVWVVWVWCCEVEFQLSCFVKYKIMMLGMRDDYKCWFKQFMFVNIVIDCILGV